ncbi:MAG: hypothetical protein HWE27_03915 [Gammaproteobacteria bacterium]|nr:hypothetical protein [Gammaproteobacteria bacterium]
MRPHWTFTAAALLLFFSVFTEASANSESSQQNPLSKQETVLSPEQIQADLKQLYQGLKSAHIDLYANIRKQDYDAAFSRLSNSIDKPLSVFEVTLLFQEFVALGKIAHAKIDLPTQDYDEYRSHDGKIFPIFIRVIDNKVFVTENYSSVTIPIGAQLLKIDGIAIDIYFAQLQKFLSADTAIMANGFLEFYLPMLIWFEHGEQNSYQISYTVDNEAVKTVNVPSMTRKAMTETTQDKPEQLQLGMERVFKMLDNQIAYLRPGPFFNTEPNNDNTWDAKPFEKFIDDAFIQFEKNNAKALVIDIRNNPGGTNSFSDYMMAKFADKPFKFASKFIVKVSPESIAANAARLRVNPDDSDSFSAKIAKEYEKRKPGDTFEYSIEQVQPSPKKKFERPVFILINRHSYSNAVFVAAIAQDYGFATVIGEETADLATTYGAMEHFNLKHSKLTVGYPKALIVRPNGDDTIRGVVPDIHIQIPVVEPVNDPVLKKAVLLIEKNQVAK